jgi:hypothetical protein
MATTYPAPDGFEPSVAYARAMDRGGFEPILVGVALAVLTAIVAGVFLGASLLTTIVVVAAVVIALVVLLHLM